MSPADQPPLPTLQAEHAELVKSAGGKVLDHLDAIRTFVARVVAAGAGLDATDDRIAAQGVINFWIARVSVAVRSAPDGRRGTVGETFDETLLADFDQTTLTRAVAAAEGRVGRLSDEDQALTRRVVLRLVRLQADAPRFEAVPTVRAALADLDDPERVGKVLDELAADGVVRVSKGETADMDRVALRAPELLTSWPSLVRWQGYRVRLRATAGEWATAGKPADRLVAGTDLEDARRYHDRNKGEREYVTASAYHQARQVEQAGHYRRRMWAFAAVALVLLCGLIGLVVLGLGWRAAAKEERTAKEAATEAMRKAEAAQKAVEADAIATSTSNLAVTAMWATEDSKAIHVAKKLLILQTLRQMLFAPTRESAEATKANWETLKKQLCDPQLNKVNPDWFRWFLVESAQERIDTVLRVWPYNRSAVDALRGLSTELKQYFTGREVEDALATVNQSVVYDAAEVAKRIAAAAAAGCGPEDCSSDRRAFWRIDCVGLVLCVPDKSPADRAAKAFADTLRKWEDDGTPASPERVTQLQETANQLSAAVATVVPPPSIDPLKLRMEEQKRKTAR